MQFMTTSDLSEEQKDSPKRAARSNKASNVSPLSKEDSSKKESSSSSPVMKQTPQQIARESMQRYCGCPIEQFGEYLILTNFPQYVDYFVRTRAAKEFSGSSFKVAHSPKENLSILDFSMGSPMAALVMDLCAYLPFKGLLMLGMAGGLRERFEVGDYFVPVGSIRAEGTSDFYFPPQVPALGNFVVQRIITQVLEASAIPYHLGITYTTNKRFWEFSNSFKARMMSLRPHVVEMECATLFTAGNKHKLPIGALLLISDLPLEEGGVKTGQSAAQVFDQFMPGHIELGVEMLERLAMWQSSQGAEGIEMASFITRDGPGALAEKHGPSKGSRGKKKNS